MRPAPSICIAGNLYFVFWKYIFCLCGLGLIFLTWLMVAGLPFRVIVSPGKSLKFETQQKSTQLQSFEFLLLKQHVVKYFSLSGIFAKSLTGGVA